MYSSSHANYSDSISTGDIINGQKQIFTIWNSLDENIDIWNPSSCTKPFWSKVFWYWLEPSKAEIYPGAIFSLILIMLMAEHQKPWLGKLQILLMTLCWQWSPSVVQKIHILCYIDLYRLKPLKAGSAAEGIFPITFDHVHAWKSKPLIGKTSIHFYEHYVDIGFHLLQRKIHILCNVRKDASQ